MLSTLLVVGVISHLWCAARLVGIAHLSFYSVRSRARLRITLTQSARRTIHFTWAGVSRTNAPQTVIVLHTHYGRKGNKLERRREREREARENESELQKLEVRII